MNHSYQLYDPALLTDSASSMALTERSLGMFAALEISPEQFQSAYDLAAGSSVHI
jgi:hypothetical protein